MATLATQKANGQKKALHDAVLLKLTKLTKLTKITSIARFARFASD